MCFGCSKEPSHWEGSFEYPQHMFWMRNKENNFPIRTLIWRPAFWRKNQASVHTYIHINVYDMLRVKTIADIKLLPTFYKAKARVDIWWEFERWLSKTAIIVYVNDKGSDECTSMQSHQNLAVSLFGSSQRKVVTKNNTIRFFLQLEITSCRFFLPIFWL